MAISLQLGLRESQRVIGSVCFNCSSHPMGPAIARTYFKTLFFSTGLQNMCVRTQSCAPWTLQTQKHLQMRRLGDLNPMESVPDQDSAKKRGKKNKFSPIQAIPGLFSYRFHIFVTCWAGGAASTPPASCAGFQMCLSQPASSDSPLAGRNLKTTAALAIIPRIARIGQIKFKFAFV